MPIAFNPIPPAIAAKPAPIPAIVPNNFTTVPAKIAAVPNCISLSPIADIKLPIPLNKALPTAAITLKPCDIPSPIA